MVLPSVAHSNFPSFRVVTVVVADVEPDAVAVLLSDVDAVEEPEELAVVVAVLDPVVVPDAEADVVAVVDTDVVALLD
jgi:hypothetical protein